GPGIELLEYLAPRDGRPMPADARANDLIHWQTRLIVRDAEAVAARFRGSGSAFVSPGAVTIPEGGLGFTKGLLVRDPDGHVVQLTDR
ncbi:MAG TPA: glyoxalase, partial [Candidatus Methylomirabilis sp.]|nr:glyoxalase [Candidatus Methylomirabilis sp.]